MPLTGDPDVMTILRQCACTLCIACVVQYLATLLLNTDLVLALTMRVHYWKGLMFLGRDIKLWFTVTCQKVIRARGTSLCNELINTVHSLSQPVED